MMLLLSIVKIYLDHYLHSTPFFHIRGHNRFFIYYGQISAASELIHYLFLRNFALIIGKFQAADDVQPMTHACRRST